MGTLAKKQKKVQKKLLLCSFNSQLFFVDLLLHVTDTTTSYTQVEKITGVIRRGRYGEKERKTKA
jgi:hypothetical protein